MHSGTVVLDAGWRMLQCILGGWCDPGQAAGGGGLRALQPGALAQGLAAPGGTFPTFIPCTPGSRGQALYRDLATSPLLPPAPGHGAQRRDSAGLPSLRAPAPDGQSEAGHQQRRGGWEGLCMEMGMHPSPGAGQAAAISGEGSAAGGEACAAVKHIMHPLQNLFPSGASRLPALIACSSVPPLGWLAGLRAPSCCCRDVDAVNGAFLSLVTTQAGETTDAWPSTAPATRHGLCPARPCSTSSPGAGGVGPAWRRFCTGFPACGEPPQLLWASPGAARARCCRGRGWGQAGPLPGPRGSTGLQPPCTRLQIVMIKTPELPRTGG